MNQFKNFPDDELLKIQVCGPENPAILALSTVRGMNYTVISENAASMEKWNWDFGYGLLDNVVTSLSCDSDNGYTLYLGQKQGTLHHRVPYTNSKTGLPDAGLYYRYDGWRDETLGGMKIPAVRNVSDVVFSKNLQVLTTLYGVSYRIKWDESEKFEDWKYFSRHRWVVDRGNDQNIKRVVPLFSNSHTNIILLFNVSMT